MVEDLSSDIRHVRLAVSGMKCGGCVAAVENVLRKQSGVREVSVSLSAQEAQLVVEPAIFDVGKMLEALGAAGYPSEISPPSGTE